MFPACGSRTACRDGSYNLVVRTDGIEVEDAARGQRPARAAERLAELPRHPGVTYPVLDLELNACVSHRCGIESCQRGCVTGNRSLCTPPYDTLLVFLRMKSVRMNCPSVIVFVKCALPRQIAWTPPSRLIKPTRHPPMMRACHTPTSAEAVGPVPALGRRPGRRAVVWRARR